MTMAAPKCRPSLRQELERGVITKGHVEPFTSFAHLTNAGHETRLSKGGAQLDKVGPRTDPLCQI